MPKYSARSAERLLTCDHRLQRVFNRVIEKVDHAILVGHRGEDDQNAAYAAKLSKLKWPHSTHNYLPSRGVDAAPYPIDWDDIDRFHAFAAIVLEVAAQEGVPLRWGGDWDGDGDTKDQTFNDLVHFELVD